MSRKARERSAKIQSGSRFKRAPDLGQPPLQPLGRVVGVEVAARWNGWLDRSVEVGGGAVGPAPARS